MFERAQAIERRHGALGAMRITLAGLSTSQAWAGQMNDAENSYGEAAEISALIGVPPPATTGVLLEVRAWQGRESESRAVASSTADWGRAEGRLDSGDLRADGSDCLGTRTGPVSGGARMGIADTSTMTRQASGTGCYPRSSRPAYVAETEPPPSWR